MKYPKIPKDIKEKYFCVRDIVGDRWNVPLEDLIGNAQFAHAVYDKFGSYITDTSVLLDFVVEYARSFGVTPVSMAAILGLEEM